jgi:predicted transcriptional regulator
MRKPLHDPRKKASRHKPGSTFVAAWMPNEIVAALDREAKKSDTDRSKLMRRAMRRYLETH